MLNKPLSYRFACTEASTWWLLPSVGPAADGHGDGHSAGPPVGHDCGEAKRHEGGRHRCPQGTQTSPSMPTFRPSHSFVLYVFETSQKLNHMALFRYVIETKILCFLIR